MTHFPPAPASLPPWPRAGDASREPQHSSGSGDRAARPRHPSVRDPRGGGGQSWLSVCQAPDLPGVAVSPRPARGAAGGDPGRGGSILLHRSGPGGGRLGWAGAMPGLHGARGAPWSGAGAGLRGRGRVPAVARLALPWVGQVPLGAFVFADPNRVVLSALAEEFWEGDDDRLMKPIKQ